MTDSKSILIHKLSILLGFEDGADEVLDHLLTIDNQDDLLDYLQQLLGKSQDMQPFVQDVGRYQRGEDVVPEEAVVVVATAGKPKLETLRPKKPPAQKPAAVLKKPPTATATTHQHAATTSPATKPEKKAATKKQEASEQPVAAAKPEKKNAPPVVPTPPARGKATFVCGCFGSLHNALTNCLYCGRISCEKEGYDFCPFCGCLVEQESVGSSGNDGGDEATKHKERLLRYDREFAQRTVILDDQADHYSNTTSAWLDDGEQAAAAASERKRQDELHKRKKMQLNLGL